MEPSGGSNVRRSCFCTPLVTRVSNDVIVDFLNSGSHVRRVLKKLCVQTSVALFDGDTIIVDLLSSLHARDPG